MDSRSVVPLMQNRQTLDTRGWMASEKFSPNAPFGPKSHSRAIRDERYKLVKRRDGKEHFYDLTLDPRELRPLQAHSLPPNLAKRYENLDQLMRELPPVGLGSRAAPPSGPGKREVRRPGAGPKVQP